MSSHRAQVRRRPRGLALVYATISLPVFLGFLVLSVDVGRYWAAGSELQAAADAAARYAAAGMVRSSSKVATAYLQATRACADERFDGRAVPVPAAAAVEVGDWNAATRVFTPAPADPAANAVRVTLTADLGGPGSMPTFAAALGGGLHTLRAVSVATATTVSFQFTAPSQGNPWLAGAADNTTITNLQGDATRFDSTGTASDPKQRPTGVSLSDLGVAPGDLISMEGLAGAGCNGAGELTYGPDGNLGWNVAQGDSAPTSAPNTSSNGISNLRAPISSFIAVFLTADAPANTAAPAALDFGTDAERDYATVEPLAKQTFFIGDGKRNDGTLQFIRVPPGATRIYFGMMDAWQWNDNVGSYSMSLYRAVHVRTVK